jgi:pimeloyl-ACP methyl ester carboxylesterase
VLLGRWVDAMLELRLSLTGWHHLFYNLLLHTRNFLGQIDASIRQDLRPYARRVAVPTLVAWGARDHTMPPRCARVLEKLLPRPHVHVAPTGSHDWIITHPDEFAEAVASFASATAGEEKISHR